VVKIQPAIVWFRDDLRLSDHPGLYEAASRGAPVVGVYVRDEQSRALKPPASRPLGGATRWWLAQSLRALRSSLEAIGGTLVLRTGPAAAVIATLAREINAGTVFWNGIAQAPHQAVAADVEAALARDGVTSEIFSGDLLVEPRAIRNKENRGLRVFTPFWRRVQGLGDPPKPLPAPKQLASISGIASEDLDDWKLEPTWPDWAGGLRESWTPGEAGAQARLKAFLDDGIKGYTDDRDRPDRDGTSRLSPHSALRRDQPAPALVRRAFHGRRASAPRRRHRQVPERARLARILPPPAVRHPRPGRA
jgi:deoxyribodipyrimidine photo-lyase